MAYKLIDVAIHKTGLTPRQTIEEFRTLWNKETAKLTILDRLRHGLQHASANLAIETRHGSEQARQPNIQIPSTVWKRFQDRHPAPYFWDTGHLKLNVRRNQYNEEWSFYDVRFCQSDVEALLSDQTSAPPISKATSILSATDSKDSRRNLPRVPADKLDKWVSLFKETYPEASQDMAVKSAFGMFQQHSLDRNELRELFPAEKRGRPRKNKD